jgi:hypothetical protein
MEKRLTELPSDIRIIKVGRRTLIPFDQLESFVQASHLT